MPPTSSLGATQGLPECYLCATSCCQSATNVRPTCYLSASCVLPMRYLGAPFVLPAAIPKGHTLNRSNLAVRRRLWAPRRRRLRRQSAGGCLLTVKVPSVQHQCYSSVPRNATKLMPLFFMWPLYSLPPMRSGDFTTSIPLLNKIGNQSRLLNSYIVYELTASIPLPRASIH